MHTPYGRRDAREREEVMQTQSATCDCGRPAINGQCARCEFLDGPIDAAKNFCAPTIIAALRLTGSMSVVELQAEIHTAPETIQRVLYRMMEAGRVGRYLVDEVVTEGEVRVYGRTRAAYTRKNVNGQARWMYYLTAKEN